MRQLRPAADHVLEVVVTGHEIVLCRNLRRVSEPLGDDSLEMCTEIYATAGGLLTAVENGGAGTVSRPSKMAAHNRAVLWEGRGTGVHSDMEIWSEIRREVLTGALSKRAASATYNVGWHPLKKILAHDEPPGYRQAKQRPKPRLDVFLPLSHPPGEAQVDFSEATVRIAGKETKVAFFVMTLPYSGAMFVQAFPKECTETFMEGHRRAFEEFGGVPRRISYDNSAIAVIEVLNGRERKLTREFLRLQSHYLFTEHFCLVRRANENGHVERLPGTARRRFLVPVPDVDSLETLNRRLLESCRQDLDERPRGRSRTIRRRLYRYRCGLSSRGA